jgi:hypothetical protein
MACGDAAPPASATADGGLTPVEAPEPAAAGDPLLSQAREGIREGMLPEPLRAEVLGSTAPAHARARRVLLAMADPGLGSSEEGSSEADDAGVDDGRPRPPPILPPADSAAVPEPVATADATPGKATAPSEPTDARPARPKAHAELGGLALRASKGGATLTIAASSSLVVGVANQPSSGIVRLMIDAADAGTSVLTARPRTEGAAVTGVRKGQGTVQITVKLEPGWSLGSVQPFSGGAKVHLVAPS